MLHGERTEMYYMPQASPIAAEHIVEAWAADRAIEEIGHEDDRPFFGLVSFFGPHPPLASPTPYNRMYDPGDVPPPTVGDPAVDHADELLPWMNHIIWATDKDGDVDRLRTRVCRARYYGKPSYIDAQVGRLLDAVEARDDAENTVVRFYPTTATTWAITGPGRRRASSRHRLVSRFWCPGPRNSRPASDATNWCV